MNKVAIFLGLAIICIAAGYDFSYCGDEEHNTKNTCRLANQYERDHEMYQCCW